MKMSAQSSRRRRASESSTTQRRSVTPSGSTPAADTATNPLMTTQPRAVQPKARARHPCTHLLVAMALRCLRMIICHLEGAGGGRKGCRRAA